MPFVCFCVLFDAYWFVYSVMLLSVSVRLCRFVASDWFHSICMFYLGEIVHNVYKHLEMICCFHILF